MKTEKDYHQLSHSGALERLKSYEITFLISRIGSKALCEAHEENHRLGLPNIFSRKGKVYFEYPDGTITQEAPNCFKQINL